MFTFFAFTVTPLKSIYVGTPLQPEPYAVPSPRYLAFTGRPFSPLTTTTWSSPGARSIAWSLHLASSPSTSNTMPLMGMDAESVMSVSSEFSPLDEEIFRPTCSGVGKWMNLNGSGLSVLVNI
jgi:hypothetical protein